eukprot:scaffold3471_cov175-Amphora_coffeaeformis.AAC.20
MNAAPFLMEEFSAFKPIDSVEIVEALSPLAIFREGESGASSLSSSSSSAPMMRRANPVDSMECCEDIIWTNDQRVISPFPAENVDGEDAWKAQDVAIEHVDFSHYFPSTTGVMECDDFSLSSASADDLVLDDDLSNPESFWDLSRGCPSPAQVSIGSNNNDMPASPTSATDFQEVVDVFKPRLMPR